MKINGICYLILVLFAGCMYGCEPITPVVPTLVEPAQAPHAERGAVVIDNRFFYISGRTIAELLPQPDGTHQTRVALQRDDCNFTGMAAAGSKIYAACTALGGSMEINGESVGLPAWSDLIRIDLLRSESDPKRIAVTRLGDNKLFPNGMAVDDKGDIYITNTYSMIFQLLSLFQNDRIDAITRVRVTDENAFEIRKDTALSAARGGMTPNGIQIQGDHLWFVSMNALFEARIGYFGLYGLKKIYQTGVLRMFDDFAILAGNTLAIAEFNTSSFLLTLFFPNAGAPQINPSQLTFVSTAPGTSGVVVGNYELSGITPSSATAIEDAEGAALYVTDFFNGGLYRVALDE